MSRSDEDSPLGLDEIEAMARKTRAQVEQELTQVLAETQTAASVHHPNCPTCQEAVVYKGRKRKVIRILSGEITLQLPY